MFKLPNYLIEFANDRKLDCDRMKDLETKSKYFYKIDKALDLCKNGFITVYEAIDIILHLDK